MRSDYIDQQRKIKIETNKKFDQAFSAFMRANQGKTVKELRIALLDTEPDRSRRSPDDHLYEIFSFEMRKRLDELVEEQQVTTLEKECWNDIRGIVHSDKK